MVVFTACSHEPNAEKIKQLIIQKEKDDLQKSSSNTILAPCMGAKTIQIPKKFEHISDILNSTNINDDYEMMNKQAHDLLDKLSIAGIITVDKTRDETFINADNRWVKAQAYNITLTAKGNEFLVGPTSDGYIVSLVDLNDVNIYKTKKQSNDTLYVFFSRNFNEIYNATSAICRNENSKMHYLPRDSGIVDLSYANNEWKVYFGM